MIVILVVGIVLLVRKRKEGKSIRKNDDIQLNQTKTTKEHGKGQYQNFSQVTDQTSSTNNNYLNASSVKNNEQQNKPQTYANFDSNSTTSTSTTKPNVQYANVSPAPKTEYANSESVVNNVNSTKKPIVYANSPVSQ